MNHLVKEAPQHCRLASGDPLAGEIPTVDMRLPLHFGLEIPHWLRRDTEPATMILPSDRILETGDLLTNEYGNSVIVTAILERRKARGDWSANPFDSAPDFVKVIVL